MHRNVRDIRMLAKSVFEFEARYVFAPTAEIIFFTVYEKEISFLVKHSDVARVKPQILEYLERFLGTSPIAFEHHMRMARTDDDLAGSARRQFIVIVVYYPDVEVIITFARRAGLGIFVIMQAGDGTGLSP